MALEPHPSTPPFQAGGGLESTKRVSVRVLAEEVCEEWAAEGSSAEEALFHLLISQIIEIEHDDLAEGQRGPRMTTTARRSPSTTRRR